MAANPEVRLVRADNPSPFTLEGTNTWVVGVGDGTWVVDPGPALEAHSHAVAAAVGERDGARWRGILLTHDHADHAAGIVGLLDRLGDAPVVAGRWPGAVRSTDDTPFTAIPTPGHAPDHLAFLVGARLFTGDAVLGRGSVFVWPDPGALRGYLQALRGLQGLELETIHPGHGPLVEEPQAKLAEYLAHRLAREAVLLEALASGRRTVEALLDAAWSDVPDVLRPAAAVTLAAHLDKLDEEGDLPEGVERPVLPSWAGQA